MRLLLFHPEHHALSCGECKRWIYDIKTAKPVLRGGAKQARKPSQPTPCGQCPKRGPEHEKEMILSRKNARTLEIYLAARVGGLTELEREDRLLRRNLAIVEQIFIQWNRQRTADAIGGAVLLGGRGRG